MPNSDAFIKKIYYKRLEIDVDDSSPWNKKYSLTIEGALWSLNGPAKYDDFGLKQWYKNGVRHRLDGPAVTWRGSEEWFVNGKKLRCTGRRMVGIMILITLKTIISYFKFEDMVFIKQWTYLTK
jgi:hypothetical protein